MELSAFIPQTSKKEPIDIDRAPKLIQLPKFILVSHPFYQGRDKAPFTDGTSAIHAHITKRSLQSVDALPLSIHGRRTADFFGCTERLPSLSKPLASAFFEPQVKQDPKLLSEILHRLCLLFFERLQNIKR